MGKSSNSLNLVSDSSMVKGASLLYDALYKLAPYQGIRDSIFISRVEGHKDSRFITASINTKKETGGAPYARAFDTGSGIHGPGKRKYRIPGLTNPSPPPFLQFMGTNEFAGQIIRVKKVLHPGVKGTNYVKRAIDESRSAIRKGIADESVAKIRLYLRTTFVELGKK